MIGDRFGAWQIVGKLGQGGMGAVYHALSPEGQDVALKILLDEFIDRVDDPAEAVARFRREARHALAVRHPNLVRTYDFGEHDKTLFIVCELLTGGSLDQRLRDQGQLNVHAALKILIGLVSALGAIDDAGLVHRDVKPANILFSGDGEVKLSDFGLARSTSDSSTILTRTGQLIGTPHYMAPEQVEGRRDLDVRVDLYAAGAVFFHCLTGSPPYVGRTLLTVLKKHLTEPVPDPRTVLPKLPTELRDLVRRLMAKRREDRPRRPAELLPQLEALRAGADPDAPPLERLVPLPRRDTKPLKPPEAGRASIGDTTPISGPSAIDVAAAETMAVAFPAAGTSSFGALEPPAPSRVYESASLGATLRRARLLTQGPGGPQTLFVYAGDRLQIGRNAVDHKGQDICLRHRPAQGSEDLITRISGQHFAITVRSGLVLIEDLQSRHGTALDDRVLEPGRPVPLTGTHDVLVARTLPLRVRVVAPADEDLIAVSGVGLIPPAPAVFIERPVNGREHSYLLLPGRIALQPGATGCLLPKAEGALEILNAGGRLMVARQIEDGTLAAALMIGEPLAVGEASIEVADLRPEDQK